jgi:hypothetical protein
MTQKNTFFLKIIIILTFLSRAYQHIVLDVPYRTIIWSERYSRHFIENVCKIKWEDFVSPMYDYKIQFFVRTIGVLFIIASICVYFINKNNYNKLKYPIVFISFWQFIMFFVITKEAFYQLGMFFEHAIQIGMSILLLYYYSKYYNESRFYFFSKFIIASTFFCHGLYAFGYYAVPGRFVDMTLNIIKTFDETDARIYLKVFGFIDFLVLPFIFIKSTLKPVLYYCVIWGLLTAFARIIASWNYDFLYDVLKTFTHETIVRLCHGLFPLFLLIAINYKKETKNII